MQRTCELDEVEELVFQEHVKAVNQIFLKCSL